MNPRLLKLRRSPIAWAAILGRRFIRGFDVLSRRTHGVREFTSEEGCILRVSLGRAEVDQALSDGTLIRRGELVGAFHLWNGRVPTFGRNGPGMAWGLMTHSRLVRSLGALSAYAEEDRRFDSVRAFCGETAFALSDDVPAGLQRFARAARFDFVRVPYATSRWGRFVEFWENFYSWLLIWTFNPDSLRGKSLFGLRRYQLWISRDALRAHYGSAASRHLSRDKQRAG